MYHVLFLQYVGCWINRIKRFQLYFLILLFPNVVSGFPRSTINRYRYFDKGRKKCTRQFRKVLWVVLVHCSSKKFERMAREAMDLSLQVLKESNKSRFDSYSFRNSVLIMSHIYLSGLSRAHFFPTTFFEIAVKLLFSVVRVFSCGIFCYKREEG